MRSHFADMNKLVFVFVQRKKRNMIAYFDTEQNDEFTNFQKISKLLRDDCVYYAALGWVILHAYYNLYNQQ